MTQPYCSGGTQDPTLALTKPEILSAVRSLYAQNLKPFGRVLLKRLRERAAARLAEGHGVPANVVDPDTMPRLNPKILRKMCEAFKQLIVTPEDGREFTVKLAGQPDTFLDACSPEDSYPEGFWVAFASYLETVKWDDMWLPGGRYACARELASRQLSFLQCFSLGQVCQIVQIATSQRRLLGYKDGWLVPYEQSEGWVKEQCACAQASTGQEVYPVVSWQEAPAFLQSLLTSHHQAESGGIKVSNLKRLFRLHYQRELSETVLGHVRLLDLLNDPRLTSVCTLEPQRNSQTMVRAVSPAPTQLLCPVVPPGMWTLPVQTIAVPVMTFAPPLEVHGVPEQLTSPGSSPRSLYSGDDCGSPIFSGASTAEGSLDSAAASDSDETEVLEHDDHDELDEGITHWAVGVKNTFIDVDMKDVRQSSPSSKQRRRSVPAHIGFPVAH